MAFDFLDELLKGPTTAVRPDPVDLDFRPTGRVVPQVDVPLPDFTRTPVRHAPQYRPTFGSHMPSIFTGKTEGTSPGAIFPERLSVDLSGFFREVTQFGRGVETFVSPLKLVGDNVIGKSFAAVGESGPGQMAQGAVKAFVVDPIEAAVRLTFGGELLQAPKGKNIFDSADPLAQLRENFELNQQTIKDVFEVAMVLPIFKVAKGLNLFKAAPARFIGAAATNMMHGPARDALLKGDLAAWVTAPVRSRISQTLSKDTVEHWGAMTGRITLGASAVGYLEAKAIDALAPDSWASRELAHNMFVPEENAMRVPLDLIESLPLDLFALAGMGRQAAIASNLQRRVLGPSSTVLDDVFSGPKWRAAAKNLPGAMPALDWLNKKSMRDAAEWSLLDDFNRDALAETAKQLKIEGKPVQFFHPSQLPIESQEAWDAAVRERMDYIFKNYGESGMRERQFAVVMGQGKQGDAGFRPGWEIFTQTQTDTARLVNLTEFHAVAKDIDKALDGTMIARIDYDIGKQIETSQQYIAQSDTWTDATRDLWANRFPASARLLEDYHHEIRRMSRDEILSALHGIITKTGLDTAESGGIARKMGSLLYELDRLNELIIGGKSTAETLANHKSIVAEIAKIRSPFTTELEKKIQTVEAALAARRAELLNEADGTYEKWAVNAEIDRLEALRLDESKRFFEAATSGTRYAIGHTPHGVVSKVFDAAADGRVIDYAGRNRGGAIWDALFGAMPNKKLGLETFKRVEDGLITAGNSKADVVKFYDELRKQVDFFRVKNLWGRSFSISAFMNVYHLPTFLINKVATDVGLKAPKGMDIAQLMYRSAPGPIKVFSQHTVGKSLDIPYNPVFVNLTRTVYPLVRFTLSPRFILMNVLEGDFFRRFIAGRNKLSPEQKDRLTAVAAQITNARLNDKGKWVFGLDDSGVFNQLEHDLEYLVHVANGPRADQMTKAMLDVLEKHPAMQDYIKSVGIRSQKDLIKHVEKTLAERSKAIEGLMAETAQEQRIVKEINELQEKLHSPIAMADEFVTRSQINNLTEKYDKVVSYRRAKIAAKEAELNDPKMQPLIDAAAAAEEKTIRHAREVLHGNPSRSAFERLGNSFLLYWPLSYQIKAGKALLSVMFDRGFGFKTNLAPAMMWADADRWVEENRQIDPQLEEFFQKNRQALFLLKGFIPATPDEIGVSLGPALRLPLQTIRGYKTPASAFERATSIGLAYDAELGQSFIAEQSKQGGILHDVFANIFGEDDAE